MAVCAGIDGGLGLSRLQNGKTVEGVMLVLLAMWCIYWADHYFKKDEDENAPR